MNLHFSYKAGKSPETEKEILQQVQKLERHLHTFRPDLVHLRGSMDVGHREGFVVSLNLRLPSGQLSSQDAADSPAAAVKVTFSELFSQLKKHKQLLRNEHKWNRQRKPRGATEPPGAPQTLIGAISRVAPPNRAEVPAKPPNGEATLAELTEAEFQEPRTRPAEREVRTYVDVNLDKLQRFIARELRFRESNGQLEPDRIAPEEVLDEVIVNALSSDERPANLTTERWLFRLARQTVRQLANAQNENGEVRLEQGAGTQNVTASDEEFLQFHQPGEVLNGESVIADRGIATPEETAASEESIDELERALRGASPEQREAFLLYVIEGFTVDEISQITELPAQAVRGAVRMARERIIKKLPANNPFKRHLVQHSSVA